MCQYLLSLGGDIVSRIFISHSSRNNAEARAIRDWLISNGWDDYFLDLDPERGIVAGQRWERALHDAANRCQAVLFLVSAAWLESEWCEKELMLAHKLDKPMFGVIIDDKVSIASLPPKLKDFWQAVDLASGRDGMVIPTQSEDRAEEQHVTFSESGLKRLKAGLDRAGLDAGFFAWPPKDDPDRSPYRGLKPLEPVDAGIFFGRDGLIVEALDRLRGLREAAAPRLFVILGASGAGKSSFMRAGIIPRMDRDDRRFLVLPPIRAAFGAVNGDAGLVQSIDVVARKVGLKKDRAAIRAAFDAGGASLSDMVTEICTKARPPVSPGDPDLGLPILVIPIDQGEELFATDAPPETATFLKRLLELLHPQNADGQPAATRPLRAAILAIITIRSDAYQRLQTSRAFSATAHVPFSVGPMSEASFKEVVVGPAEVLNRNTGRKLQLKQDFVDTLLGDVISDGGVDKMPLLAFVMERMFLDHGGDDVITLDEYRQSGGIGGAVDKAVNDALAAFIHSPDDPKGREAVMALLRTTLIPRLAVVDPATREPQGRSALRADLPAEGLPLIDAFVEKRLLIADSTPDGGQTRLQIAHEALLRQWQPMREWLRADGEAIAMLRRARDAAHEWNDRGRDEDWLQHSGTLLDRAREQAGRRELESLVDSETSSYFAACKVRDERRDAERENRTAQQLADSKRIADEQRKVAEGQREISRRTRIGAAAATILVVAASCLFYYFTLQSSELEMAKVRLVGNMHLRIAVSVPGSVSPQIINENWYKIASDRSRSVVILRVEKRGIQEVGTGFIMQGSDVIEGYGSAAVIVTCTHNVENSNLRDAYFPGIEGNNHLEIGKLIWHSPVNNLDISIFSVKSSLPFGAIPISNVTESPISSLVFDPEAVLTENATKTSLAMIGYVGTGPSVGFQLSIMQPLRSTEIHTEMVGGISPIIGSRLSYTYASGPGASGSPVFDANTGELLCMHRSGFPGDSSVPYGECTWLGDLKKAIQANLRR